MGGGRGWKNVTVKPANEMEKDGMEKGLRGWGRTSGTGAAPCSYVEADRILSFNSREFIEARDDKPCAAIAPGCTGAFSVFSRCRRALKKYCHPAARGSSEWVGVGGGGGDGRV